MKKPGIRSNKTNHTNGAGLTLVELLVVISIMMIMTAVVFVNYRPGNQQLALNRSASKLAQDIRRAQEMAMSSAECPLGTGCAGQVPPGYGIALDRISSSTEYYLYADNGDEVYGAGDTIIGDPIDLERGVYIGQIRGTTAPMGNANSLSVNFNPPDPVVNIYTQNPDVNGRPEIKITIALESDSSKTKTVVINNAGLIYVE